ncbi:MAG TPA: PadR family transcriptional regulator [Thermoplasmata archaeon]|nr:PadR family transcriptional regulator [Thermoplasmata archaeon]
MLGLYALSVMEREGAIYGYSLTERIAERTDGGWRPGPGAVYPALQSLVRKRLAHPSRDGRRRVYRITPSGRSFLRRLRSGFAGRRRSGPDLGALWSEIVGGADPGQPLLDHLRHHLEGMTSYLERTPGARAGGTPLLDQVRAELRVTESRLAALGRDGRSSSAPRTR